MAAERTLDLAKPLSRLIRGPRRRPATPAPTELKSSYDAIVIGGGPAAFAIAYELASRHGMRDVAVLQPGPGVSALPGFAVLRISHAAPELVALAARARAALAELRREVRLPPVRRPLLDLAFSGAELASLNRAAGAARHAGETAWLVPPLEVLSHLPFRGADEAAAGPLAGALFEPSVEILDEPGLTRALARAAESRGVHVVAEAAVRVRLERNKAIGVRLGKSAIAAGAVVIADAGEAAARLEAIGIGAPLSPCNVLALTSEPAPRITATVATGRRLRGSLLQEEGGAFTFRTASAQTGPLRTLRADAVAALLACLPALGGLDVHRERQGLVDVSPDGAPLIGAVGPARLTVACGFGPDGAGLGVAAAQAIAAEIASGTTDPVVEPFGLDRFAAGRLLGAFAGAANPA